jgi:hypothetical protein
MTQAGNEKHIVEKTKTPPPPPQSSHNLETQSTRRCLYDVAKTSDPTVESGTQDEVQLCRGVNNNIKTYNRRQTAERIYENPCDLLRSFHVRHTHTHTHKRTR